MVAKGTRLSTAQSTKGDKNGKKIKKCFVNNLN